MGLLDAIVPGLGVVSSLGGLLGSQSAERRARQAREKALSDLQAIMDREYLDTQGSNRYNLAASAGGLNDALASSGRGLGDALQGAGIDIRNYSPGAGALSNLAMNNSQYLTDFAVRNRQGEQAMLNANRRYLAGLQYGGASGDLDYQRGMTGNYMNQFSGYLGNLGQAFGSKKPAQPYGGSLPGDVTHGLGMMGRGSGIVAGDEAAVYPGWGHPDPIQSAIQRLTQRNSFQLGAPNIRETGPYIFGNQGANLPKLFRRNPFGM